MEFIMTSGLRVTQKPLLKNIENEYKVTDWCTIPKYSIFNIIQLSALHALCPLIEPFVWPLIWSLLHILPLNWLLFRTMWHVPAHRTRTHSCARNEIDFSCRDRSINRATAMTIYCVLCGYFPKSNKFISNTVSNAINVNPRTAHTIAIA